MNVVAPRVELNPKSQFRSLYPRLKSSQVNRTRGIIREVPGGVEWMRQTFGNRFGEGGAQADEQEVETNLRRKGNKLRKTSRNGRHGLDSGQRTGW